MKNNKILKKALEKSIKQWQLMVDNPEISKANAYIETGGINSKHNLYYCFLCDVYRDFKCKGCLTWKNNLKNLKNIGFFCIKEPSPFYFWTRDRKNLKYRKNILNYLKYEYQIFINSGN